MQGARQGTRSRISRIMPWTEGSAKPLGHPGALGCLSMMCVPSHLSWSLWLSIPNTCPSLHVDITCLLSTPPPGTCVAAPGRRHRGVTHPRALHEADPPSAAAATRALGAGPKLLLSHNLPCFEGKWHREREQVHASECGLLPPPQTTQWHHLSLHHPLASSLQRVTPVAARNRIQRHLPRQLPSLLAFWCFHHACLPGCSRGRPSWPDPLAGASPSTQPAGDLGQVWPWRQWLR